MHSPIPNWFLIKNLSGSLLNRPLSQPFSSIFWTNCSTSQQLFYFNKNASSSTKINGFTTLISTDYTFSNANRKKWKVRKPFLNCWLKTKCIVRWGDKRRWINIYWRWLIKSSVPGNQVINFGQLFLKIS